MKFFKPSMFIAWLIVIAILETFLNPGNQGSLLFTIVIWMGIVQGCIALVAAVELTNGKWITPLKPRLLAVYPMILFLAAIFILLAPQMNMYPWIDDQGTWLNKTFFIIRNLVLMLLTYGVARKFSLTTLNNRETKNIYAVIYLFLFMTSQSLVAFDLVMSLEYPWVSTLFGGYFAVESIFAGIAITGILCYISIRDPVPENSPQTVNPCSDTATMLFGFSLFWAGLFFTQYLVIWYGNIPEETSYIYDRISPTPLREMSVLVLLLMFPVPFITFLFSKSKSSPRTVMVISFIVLFGLAMERVVFIMPVTGINWVVLIMETLMVSLLFTIFINTKKQVVS